ncbi:type VII toxin-antitoxin system MntA family adenylyltransferase antitoxin [Effusibacillus lacus]|uniref:DNA polymerase subunit beta n=1 Tax=Effusibacillus lacus TaxID=1348429 RepID=A0A292YPA3_9BACL|nr:nucleotidyltransferase domain-containing protein [Effusibacillus lacus]TCS72320.1 putative nucleotidyltransferase [Effusibacillus lacus]GAX90214.1 DNA polymerase subunit beta [Effusibacillus lacus]
MDRVNQAQVKLVTELLSERLSPYTLYLFGSGAQGKMREDSDLDIAYLTDKEVSDYESFMLAQELADQLGLEVDLVNLKKASTVFQAQIIGKGKVILDLDPPRRMMYQIRILKDYALLNEERQCIFDKLQERGSIFNE